MGVWAWLNPVESKPTAAAPPARPVRAGSPATSSVANAPILTALLQSGVGSYSRSQALEVPAIQRGRDLVVGTLASLPLVAVKCDTVTLEETRVEPPLWCNRPDPSRPRSWTIGGTVDDLVFYATAFWRITKRYAESNYPAAFEWMPLEEVDLQTPGHLCWTPGLRSGLGWQVAPQTIDVPLDDVVQFLSPFAPVLSHAARAIRIAIALDEAAERFAAVELPAGWIQQEQGEPLTPTELEETATSFAVARKTNTVAALGLGLTWHESQQDPERLQLVDARNYQATELGRLLNVPAALLDAERVSTVYSNQRDQLAALWWLCGWPIANAMSEVLSGPNMVAKSLTVRLDPEAIGVGAPDFAQGSPAGDRPRPGASTPADNNGGQ